MLRILSAVALALLSLDAAAAVSGFVLDEDGKPLAGVRVRAFALEPVEAQFARLVSATPEAEPVSSVQTDDKGAFRLDAKRQPVVTLLVDAPGRVPQREDLVDGDTITFLLRAAAMKKGRVTANGKGVAGAWVIVNHLLYAKTDEKGEYSMPDPSTWAMQMFVVHPDFAIFERVRMQTPLPLDVALETGAPFTGRVVDPSGRPVANAVVHHGNWPVAKSGEDGSFTIAHLQSNAAKSLRASIDKRIGAIKGSTITVRPAGTVAGTVRGAKDDLPVAGMRVTVRLAASPAAFKSVITDAKGAFVVEGIPAGEPLALAHPAFAHLTADVHVADGARVERPLTASPLGRLNGTVVDDQKKPVSGVVIHPMHAIANRAVTAPDGTFAMRMPPSAVTLEATKKPYPPVSHGPVRVEPGEVKSARIVLSRGKTFEIVLVDTDGVPVANEPLHISRRIDPDNLYATSLVRCGEPTEISAGACRSDAEGKLALSVGEGVYDIRAGGETTIEKELRGQNLAAETSPLTIELERGALVEGRVVWSDGTAVAGTAHIVAGGELSGAGAVATDGAFTMRNLPAGKVVLTARTVPPAFIESEPVEVTAPASGVVLKLPRPGRIEGRVVERDNERPIHQFTVSIERRGTMRRGNMNRSFTAEDGRFVLEDVAPGTVDVSVAAPGFVRATTSSVEVPEGKTATVEVSLGRAGTIAGRVTAAGRPVSGAGVTIGEQRGRMAPQKQTDANGDYVLDTVPAGSHDVVVRKQGYVPRTITVSVSVGKETRGDVELSRGREVTGRVIDSGGRPVAGAEVMFHPAGGGRPFYSMPQQSDADGAFRLEGLGDETYNVSARKAGYLEASAEVTPSTPSVTLTLSRGGTLSGRVSGLPPAELSTVEVSVISRGGSRTVATVDPTGAFTLNGVPDGDVTVTAAIHRPRQRTVQAQVKVSGGSGPFVELDFASGMAVRGRVTLRGQPVRGMLHLVAAGAQGQGRSGGMAQIQSDGAYEVRVQAAGQYRVLVTMQNGPGTIEIETIDVRGEMEHDVDVRGGSLRARVVDSATGAPVPEAMVSIVPAQGRSMSASERPTDSSGVMTMDFVAEGRYTIRANKEAYSSAAQDVSIENGRASEVELAVGQAELVLVTVVDAQTGANAQGYLAVLDASGRPLHARGPQRDATGAFRLWLGAGTYTLQAMGPLYELKRVQLTVPGTPTVRIELARKKE